MKEQIKVCYKITRKICKKVHGVLKEAGTQAHTETWDLKSIGK